MSKGSTTEREPKDGGSAVLSVRFSAEEIEELRRRAERAGVPVSALVRRSATGRQSTRATVTVGTPLNATVDPKRQPALNVVGYNGSFATPGKNA